MKPSSRHLLAIVLLVGAILLIASLFASCRGDAGSHETRWPALTHDADSLTRLLERGYADGTDMRELSRATDTLRAIAAASPDRRLAVRALYWEARRLERTGRLPEARERLRVALGRCDSQTNEYDYRRIRLILDRLDGTRPIARYARLVEDERFFRHSGDLQTQASVAQQLGNLFITTLRYPDALRYLLRTDSLLDVAGLDTYRLKNRVNVAMAYFHSGDSASADSTLRPLLTSPVILDDAPVRNTVLRNMHVITGDRRYLLEAYRLLPDSPIYEETAVTYAAILSDAYAKEEINDSADHYAGIAFRRLDLLTDWNWRGMAIRSYARKLRREGKADSLVMVQDMMLATLDSLYAYRQTVELDRLENKRGIELVREASEAQRQRQKTRYVVIIFAVILAAVVGLAVLMRRNARQKLRHLEYELETERDRRRLLSMAMKMEEKEGFLGSVRKEVAQLKETHPCAEASRLEALLKANESERMTREYFFESFEKLNPAFIPNLKRRCPDLTESLLQLACLIVTGIDNRRISEILSVRPASVNQSRWRLRARLGLPKEASLEEALRALI